MVPITFLSFYLASKQLGLPIVAEFTEYDTYGLIIAGSGVFIYNWFKEKPQVASI